MTTTQRTATSASTRGLLACGAIAGPLFVGATLVQAATRDGFDPIEHPLSLLSLSDLGWIQITNFVLSGLLALAGAFGIRRALDTGPASTWGPRLLGLYGISLVWGGVFVADPALGYPAGAPEGSPAEQSWHSILHSFAPVGTGLALLVACFLFARRFAREQRKGPQFACYAVVALYVVLSALSFALADFRWMLAGGAVIWLWAAAIPLDALRR
jgi:hypothetical protein